MGKKFKYTALIFFAGFWMYSITEPLYTPTALPVGTNHYDFPEIIAHKALTSDEFPGNSLSAITEALSSTVDGIEVDVRISKDGVLFLYHGDTLEEYTDHQGIPEDYDWSHLSQVQYKYTEENLISLDEFFAIVGTQKVIFLDVKSNNKIDTEMAYRIVDCIKRYQLQDNVFVESFNPITLAAIRLYSRDIMLMYDFADNITAFGEESQDQFNKIPWVLKQHWVQKQVRRIIRPDVLGPRFNLAPKLLADLVSHGYPIISWTVDDFNNAQSLYKSGVKGLQSNKPHIIENIVRQKHKRILDAGGSSEFIHSMIKVNNIKDIQEGIKIAKQKGKPISIGGRRHSMGGQTFFKDAIFLNMLNFNNVTYNPKTNTVTAQAGATWQKIQEILARHGRSVKVMQSDNIFTVGGSIGVNVHGWQVGSPPIVSAVLKMTVITSDGEIQTISPSLNSELFNAVIGGYGMFAVIVDAELETVPNSLVKFHALFTKAENFHEAFEKNISNNSKVELAYARLSTDQNNLLNEVGLFWYETQKTFTQKNDIGSEKLIAIKRSIFRLSEYHNLGKKLRWQAEKTYTKMLAEKQTLLSRNDAMNTDIHILWPLYGKNKDVLHEYFIPKKYVSQFIQKLKTHVIAYNINILNVTIREVKNDDMSSLPYAKKDVYGLVCLFSQEQTLEDEKKMKIFTQAVIDDALTLNGTFYLPYRLHYTTKQLLSSYPEINRWMELKKKYDPNLLFQSQFFAYINTILNKESEDATEPILLVSTFKLINILILQYYCRWPVALSIPVKKFHINFESCFAP
jgi:FAD/FMN-containing dehydrogenase/glycerophosphoryl diester phosphodiesterase